MEHNNKKDELEKKTVIVGRTVGDLETSKLTKQDKTLQ